MPQAAADDTTLDLRKALADIDPRAFETALTDFVARQRWFAAKSQAPRRAALDGLALLPGSAVHALSEVVVDTVDGEQRYLLPLSVTASGADLDPAFRAYEIMPFRDGERLCGLLDGARDASLVTHLVSLMAKGVAIDVPAGGRLRIEASHAAASVLAAAALVPRQAISVISGEQSNTSIVIGRVAILKLYRRMRDGLQPELEVTRFLTERTDFTGTPPLLGSMVLERPDGSEAAIAALFGLAENEGDAWAVVTEDLGRQFAAEALFDTQSAKAGDPGTIIGRRTGEMHRALGTVTGDAAFDPEPIDAGALARLIETAKAEVRSALAVLARLRRSGAEVGGMAGEIDRLLGSDSAILSWFDGFGGLAVSTLATRIHGDYHLGQLLVSKGDVVILDFEGEPGATMAERREKTSPLRDVAGMLRSFDYAAFAALDTVEPVSAPKHQRLEAMAAEWRETMTERFLTAWSDASGIDLGQEAESRLLDLFLLQKAFYELRYEAASRPAWLPIPLRGITSLLEKRQVLA